MENPIVYKSTMKFEHQQWKREILFWKEELKSFNNRLRELHEHWTNKEGLLQIEYYKNKFMVQADITEDLLETIAERENQVSEQSGVDTNMLDAQMSSGHLELRNRIKTQRDLYDELKRNFFRFFNRYVNT